MLWMDTLASLFDFINSNYYAWTFDIWQSEWLNSSGAMLVFTTRSSYSKWLPFSPNLCDMDDLWSTILARSNMYIIGLWQAIGRKRMLANWGEKGSQNARHYPWFPTEQLSCHNTVYNLYPSKSYKPWRYNGSKGALNMKNASDCLLWTV